MARIVAATVVSIVLLGTSASAGAADKTPRGSISGSVVATDFPIRVTATRKDGTSYRTKVNGKLRYRIAHLPAGIYSLRIAPSCGASWRVDNVTVGDGETNVPVTVNPGGCVRVGR